MLVLVQPRLPGPDMYGEHAGPRALNSDDTTACAVSERRRAWTYSTWLLPHTSCDFDFLVFSQLNSPDRPLRLTDFVPIVVVGPRCAN